MAKGDHDRGERRIDEQMRQMQGYLAPLQNQLGNQYGAYNNMFWGGGGAPQRGNVFGYGSTVPHYSPYDQPMFSGNGTDTRMDYNQGMSTGRTPGGMTQIGSGQSQGAIDKNKVMQILQKYGPASSENLQRALPELQQLYPGIRPDKSGGPLDELVYNGQIVDLISNAEGGGKKDWTFQTGGGGGGSNFLGGNSPGGVVGRNLGDYGDIYGRMSQWAEDGGLTEGDKANLRSRAVSPIRSIYSRGRQELGRQRSLQGGYSPGFSTALGRFNREQGQLTSDAATNAEAAITDMQQRGRQFGLSGMLNAYGATPGLSNMFGNQMLTSMGQQLQASGLQNQIGLGLIGGQNNLSQTPGDVGGFFNGLGNFARNASGAIYPWLGGGGAGGPGSGGTGPAGPMPSPYGYG